MPATITLSNLSWSTPDGRPLFSHLDLSFGAERTGLVGRNGVGKSTLLKLISGSLVPQSGSIRCSGRLGLLDQRVQVGAEETLADLFGARPGLELLERAERGLASADDLALADWTLDARLSAALAAVGLAFPHQTRLATLSGGQRTRARLAALTFWRPDMILLDEPTNDLDREGRRAVIDLVAAWRGAAIVISHDRELLETMEAIVELTSLGAQRYGGNFSAFMASRQAALDAAEQGLAEAERRLGELSARAQTVKERKAKKDGAGKRKAARGDMPKILLGGMKETSETTGGGQTRLSERRLMKAEAEAAEARSRIEVLQPLAVKLAPTGLPAGRTVLAVDRLSFGYDPQHPILTDLTLTITGPERVALTGGNGSGKTTLLKLLTGRCRPWSGRVDLAVDHALLDQGVSLLDPALSIRDNFRQLNPQSGDNACRAALARFMFRAEAALQPVGTLSGGQMLRAGLACTLGGERPPSLLILDEPTNHLDFDAIAAVEAGLNAYDGALLVVSHDEAFLKAIGVTRRVSLLEA